MDRGESFQLRSEQPEQPKASREEEDGDSRVDVDVSIQVVSPTEATASDSTPVAVYGAQLQAQQAFAAKRRAWMRSSVETRRRQDALTQDKNSLDAEGALYGFPVLDYTDLDTLQPLPQARQRDRAPHLPADPVLASSSGFDWAFDNPRAESIPLASFPLPQEAEMKASGQVRKLQETVEELQATLARVLRGLGDRPSHALSGSVYGRDSARPVIPYDLDRTNRGYLPSAVMDPRIRIPPPESFKGDFNDHAKLEAFITRSRGYYAAAGKISTTESITTDSVRHFVSSLFSSLDNSGISPLNWITARLDQVGGDAPYTLVDLYADMRLFWSDPMFKKRLMDTFMAVRQGIRSANVYGATVKSLVSQIDRKHLTDTLVVRVFIAGLNPAARAYVDDQILIEERVYRDRGLGEFTPALDRLIDWASARDNVSSSTATANPSRQVGQTDSPARSTSRSVPLSSTASPRTTDALAPRPPRPSSRSDWELRAQSFQDKFSMSSRSTWPASRPGIPPTGTNCWNCAQSGHWTMACPNSRVIPKFAILSSIQGFWGMEDALDYESVGLDVDEFNEYGAMPSTDSVGDLLGDEDFA